MTRSMRIYYHFKAETPCRREMFFTGLAVDTYRLIPISELGGGGVVVGGGLKISIL